MKFGYWSPVRNWGRTKKSCLQLNLDSSLVFAVFYEIADVARSTKNYWLATHSQTYCADHCGLAGAIGTNYDVQIGSWHELQWIIGTESIKENRKLFYRKLSYDLVKRRFDLHKAFQLDANDGSLGIFLLDLRRVGVGTSGGLGNRLVHFELPISKNLWRLVWSGNSGV